MNKKFIIKGTDVEVKVGDCLHVSNLEEKDLVNLTKAGILQERNAVDLVDVVKKLANKMGISLDACHYTLELLEVANPAIVFSLLLKEVAIMLDKQYEGHIMDSEYLWIVSTKNGEIKEIPASFVNSNTSSLFRTKEDAEYACNILEYYWNLVWGDEQED